MLLDDRLARIVLLDKPPGPETRLSRFLQVYKQGGKRFKQRCVNLNSPWCTLQWFWNLLGAGFETFVGPSAPARSVRNHPGDWRVSCGREKTILWPGCICFGLSTAPRRLRNPICNTWLLHPIRKSIMQCQVDLSTRSRSSHQWRRDTGGVASARFPYRRRCQVGRAVTLAGSY